VYRLSALRVASAFRTVSEDAVCVIAGMLPINVLAEKRQALYRRKRLTELTTEELRTEERQNSIRRWQVLWKAATNSRWTYRLIPNVDVWLSRKHGEVNYYLTQMLSGHGCFRAYLHRFRHEKTPECPTCPGVSEDAEHVFVACPRFNPQKNTLETALKQQIRPKTLVGMMLASKAAWNAMSTFATDFLQELRRTERKRAKS